MPRWDLFSRTAVAVPVIAVTAAATVLLTLATGSHSATSPTCSSGAANTPTPPPPPPPKTVASPAAASPPVYTHPIGDQYLGEWGPRLAAGDDGPPRLFLLSAADLASPRYMWQLPRLAETMADELASVLDEGCRGRACSAEVEHARASLRTFVDGDATRTFGAPRLRKWTTGDDIHEFHRELAITGRLGATTFDVACTCTSWIVGMRVWNDVAECEATLRERGKTVVRYAPITKRGYEKESLLLPLDAHDQVVTFPSGATLTIESGYEYEGDDVNTPRTRSAPRGAVLWTNEPAPR